MSMHEGSFASALTEVPAQLMLNHESLSETTPRVGFAARALRGVEPFTDAIEIPVVVSVEKLIPAGFAKLASARNFMRDVLARGTRGSVLVRVLADSTIVFMSAASEEQLEVLYEEVRGLALEAVGNRDSADIDLVVWWHTGTGARTRTRRVSAPAWHDVAENYPDQVRHSLVDLMLGGSPEGTGRLILWHGEPGTGKTTAVLALLRAWQEWCEGFLITDPERMFMESHDLQEVLTTELTQNRLRMDRDRERPRWRLIVAEDADEYLRSDAKQQSGPALGRLLNASDGILGRGTRTIILLTTNDELGRLHPAVTRPGRAMAIVDFARFTPVEANRWLAGSAIAPAHGATLAELYELRDHAAGPGVKLEPETSTGAYL